MPYLPKLPGGNPSQQSLAEFAGYHHNLKIEEGEFFGMENLSCACYPMLATRPLRGILGRLATPNGFSAAAGQVLTVDGSRLFLGRTELTGYLSAKGLTLQPDGEKQLVCMGAYIVIFPDKLYISTADFADCGTLEAFSRADAAQITPCDQQGNPIAPIPGAAPPEEPASGQLWLDTANAALMQYGSSGWVQLTSVFAKITAPGIGIPFRENDGVEISGCAVAECNGSHVLQRVTDDSLVILCSPVEAASGGSITVSRSVPDLDFVIECGNRLWGCKYGMAQGRAVNEIYCCALGDFRNWSRYRGTAADSFAASVGAPGIWTGAVAYQGNPIFFKEDRLYKVYPSATGAHRIVENQVAGVEAGSGKSLQVVGKYLYYLSPDGICGYDGSLPTQISRKLGYCCYRNGTAGVLGDRYYISMQHPDGEYELFCLDTQRGLWHREDNTHALGFAALPGECCMLCADGSILSLTGLHGQPEDTLQWSATSGIVGYHDPNHKYISRLSLRMELHGRVQLELQYDSDGIWHDGGSFCADTVGSFLLPVRPRRCDHFRYRLRGEGSMKLLSLTRHYASGSDCL